MGMEVQALLQRDRWIYVMGELGKVYVVPARRMLKQMHDTNRVRVLPAVCILNTFSIEKNFHCCALCVPFSI